MRAASVRPNTPSSRGCERMRRYLMKSMQAFVSSLVLAWLGCATPPRVVPAAFPLGAKIAVAEYQSRSPAENELDLSESYDAFRRELGECRNAEVIDFDPVS